MGIALSCLSPGWTSPLFQQMTLGCGQQGKDDPPGRGSWWVVASWGSVCSWPASGLLFCSVELTASSCRHLIIASMPLSWREFRGEKDSHVGWWGLVQRWRWQE